MITDQDISLTEILHYKNENVILSFSNKFGISLGESVIIFEDMLRFLYLGHNKTSVSNAKIAIDQTIQIIDEMWHIFILHTKDYTDFCNIHFGSYVHHKPTPVSDKINFSNKISLMNEQERIDFLVGEKRKFYYLVYNTFGVDTFNRWFNHYSKYSAMMS